MDTRDPLLGQIIKGYRLQALIGEGGMGRVYRAEHPSIGKKVAFKILHSPLAQDPLAQERFFREARAVNAIGHDNIIDILDLDTLPGGQPYLLMELLEGRSLDTVLQHEAPLSVARLGHVGLQICAALAAAHQHGVIHRDLKPENVFLLSRPGRRDYVKLLDFGIAKLLREEGRLQTQTGIFVGTPLYVSPEQFEGELVDARADIYSLGVILYWMATGQKPFVHENPFVLAALRSISDLPAPRQKNPALPEALEALIIRCLAVERESRFPSMEEVARALATACGQPLERYLEPAPSVREQHTERLPALELAPDSREAPTRRTARLAVQVAETLDELQDDETLLSGPRLPAALREAALAPSAAFAVVQAAAPTVRAEPPVARPYPEREAERSIPKDAAISAPSVQAVKRPDIQAHAIEWTLDPDPGTDELPTTHSQPQSPSRGSVQAQSARPEAAPAEDEEEFRLPDPREMETVSPSIHTEETRILPATPAPLLHEEPTRLGLPWWRAAWVRLALVGGFAALGAVFFWLLVR